MRCNAEANAPGLRHGFDDVYLEYQDPHSQIMNAVRGQISVLKDPAKAKEARDNGAIDSDHDQAGIIPTAKSLPYLGLLAAVMIAWMRWALKREEQEV